VEKGVRLEVLDWGGSGRPVVLLAGSGHSAHVFDDFAPKLADCCHVYGITQRGYGASSQPASGYDEQRLADDVLRVLDSLRIEAPVLAGHSMAGGELTLLGNQHSRRLGGLVYIAALGDPTDWPASDPAYIEIVRKLPGQPETSPPRCPQDRSTFAGYRAWQMCTEKFAFPESELRNTFATNLDGTRGPHKTPRSIHRAIGDGARKRDYSGIRVPVLSFSEPMPAPDAPPGPDD
jgi:pimeloyl-ACP methyl ester carboxylesterase